MSAWPALAQPWGRIPPVPNRTPDPPYTVTERGTFWRTWSRTRHLTDPATGATVEKVDTYKELGHGICYENPNKPGEWLDSQDVIELTPTGAAATQGPTKAYFAADLNTPGAITLTTAAGETFKSHPLGLYYRDLASGKVALIAELQDATGVLVPPNMVVYTNALAGLKASFLYVWAHNGFDQTLVLEESPPSPDALAGFNPATTVLEVHTALDSWPSPRQVRPVVLKPGATAQLDLVDHILFFADTWLPVGAAFSFGDADLPAPGQPGQVRPADPSDTNKFLVAKSVVRIGGQTVLLESVNYMDVVKRLSTLSLPGGRADRGKSSSGSGQERKYAAAGGPHTSGTAEFSVAGAGVLPRGFALDYDLSGTIESFTFQNGVTYYIQNGVTIYGTAPGDAATFQNNCVIKYAANAYLMVCGPVSFPAGVSGGPVLFSSMNDDGVGAVIQGSTSRPTASGGAGHELFLNEEANSITVQNAFFRFARCGLMYFFCSANQTVQNTSFKDCTTGINADYPAGGGIYLQNNACYSDVPTPVSGSVNGSVTQVNQTDIWFDASQPGGTPNDGDGSEYTPFLSGQSLNGTRWFDVYVNETLNNTLANRWIPGCGALVIHLKASVSPYVTAGIVLPTSPQQYYARGLTLQGAGQGTTVVQLMNYAPFDGDIQYVFEKGPPTWTPFFFAPFTMSDMMLDCNWVGQGYYNNDISNPLGKFKSGGVFMSATSVNIQNVTVKNFGAKGIDIVYKPEGDAGTEAFAIWAVTANLGQSTPAITIQNCEVTGFTSAHGGYATCIDAITHWDRTRVPGDTTVWSSWAALVQNNRIHDVQNTIGLGTPSAGNALQTDWTEFLNNTCDGVGLGFNSDCGGANNISISNNTFTNCYQGINLGGPWGCGNYNVWTSISISGNHFMLLSQPSLTAYYRFYTTNSTGCPTPTGCVLNGNDGSPYGNSQYGHTVWDDCFAIRLAGGCGSSVNITGNACTTPGQVSWRQPSGGLYPYTYYFLQVLNDSYVAPGLGSSCGHDNADPGFSGNIIGQLGYWYSPYQSVSYCPNCLYSVPAHSGLVTSLSFGSNLRNDVSCWLGFRFQVGNSPIIVTHLGRWVLYGNSQSHFVKLVNADGSDVTNGEVTVNTLGQSSGQYAYVGLTSSITLSPNTAYYLVSQEQQGFNQWYDDLSCLMTVAPIVSGVYPAWANNGSQSYTYYTDQPSRGYVPVSLLYQR